MSMFMRIAAKAVLVATMGVAAASLTQATASAADWNAVAQCESGGNWSTNTGNGYSGGLQFTPQTWHAYGGSGDASSASKSEQIAVANKVLAAQGPGAWPNCFRGGSTPSSSSTSSYTPQKQTYQQPVKKYVAPAKQYTPKQSYTPQTQSYQQPVKHYYQPQTSSAGSYTVQSGDTLSGIAAKYGTTVQALAAKNGLSDPDVLSVGQVLNV